MLIKALNFIFRPLNRILWSFSDFSFLGIINIFANLLIVAGFGILVYTYYPVIYQEYKYAVEHAKKINAKIQIKNALADGTFTLLYGDKEIKPVSTDFSLIIPKIDVNSIVFRNVSSYNESEYLEVLKKGLAHAKETMLPGRGVSFIFGHSTDAFYNITKYNAQFFLLGKLTKDDDVFVVLNKDLYKYKVVESKILWPSQVSSYVASLKNSELVLQTCYPPGTTLQRLVVKATPVLN